MKRAGFILVDKKRPRVLTAAFKTAAEQHGFEVVALDARDVSQWQQADPDVLVHKVPEDAGLDAKLIAYRQSHPHVVIVDHPAAVRLLQDRATMLKPLQDKDLVITQPGSWSGTTSAAPAAVYTISIPAQATLLAGCSVELASQLLATAGITWPALVKPLRTAPPDSAGAGVSNGSYSSTSNEASKQANSINNTSYGISSDAHTLGAVMSHAGLVDLVCSREPALQLPVILQQFVPHGQALYKLYVIGPHVVLTRRSTLTGQQLYAAASTAVAADPLPAASPAADVNEQLAPGLVLLQRVSAVPLPLTATSGSRGAEQTVAVSISGEPQLQLAQPQVDFALTGQQHSIFGHSQQHHHQQQRPTAQQLVFPQQPSNALQGQHTGDYAAVQRSGTSNGRSLCDDSVAGDAAAPPMWAMQQLAAYLRQQLQLNLFNVDIIVPEQQETPVQLAVSSDSSNDRTRTAAVCSCCLVVDINYFPGYDKVPGAEALFADYLSSLL
eukprot:GHRR01020903.1.p1 GENE.GHRR01020903.1~~GHRR01020903.1.p1  ORF type:complete len:497 (+),score=218.65 GHRR01020903.1:511-2001(+)